MSRIVFANDRPYTERYDSGGVEIGPLDALRNTLAFSADDWSQSRAMAWVYGIVLGWDAPAAAELAGKFGWDKDAVERLGVLHQMFDGLDEWAPACETVALDDTEDAP